jgi:GNAT superfamily N-acetyltransferase
MRTDELDAVCNLIGQAFSDNPSTLANVRGDRGRAARVMRKSARFAKFGRRFSEGLVAVRDGEIVGALNACAWPRCQLGLIEKVASAPGMVRASGLSLARTMAMANQRAKHDPKRPHWHIGPIGVRPGLHGQGIGRALLDGFLEGIDRETAGDQRAPAFLETDVERNASIYERFGFVTVSRAVILGVDTRFMWRDVAS